MGVSSCAEIHLENLAYNFQAIQKKAAPSRVIPVVKADAYGHGAVPVARCLAKAGIRLFAVAHFNEAMELRAAGILQPILIFARLLPDEIPVAVASDFRITVFGEDDIRWIESAQIRKPARIHVNVDSGMGRMGVLINHAPSFFNRLTSSRQCVWEGLYSHFSTADEKDKTYALFQLSAFNSLRLGLNQKGFYPQIVHMANSGAILDLPESAFDAVRPGILLYGHYPSSTTSASVDIRPVMTLKTVVAHVRKMPADHFISYGRRWKTTRPTTLAVLPIGYADGVRRQLTHVGKVLLRGKRYPMVGMVTMDHIMVDVGDDPVEIGDTVIIWGDSPQGGISVLETAEKIGAIPYELICGVSKRVPRIYIDPAEPSF